MNKQVFLMGMRRSGTSILRDLMNKHPDIQLEFEPYELFYTVATSEMGRYKAQSLRQEVLKQYTTQSIKWYGAKFAFNPGIEAMKWKCFNTVFPNAHFVFIIRNPKDTYASWVKQDKNSVRGICDYPMYMNWHYHITQSFEDKSIKSTIIKYEDLVNNADKEMLKVWNLLNVTPITRLNNLMRKK